MRKEWKLCILVVLLVWGVWVSWTLAHLPKFSPADQYLFQNTEVYQDGNSLRRVDMIDLLIKEGVIEDSGYAVEETFPTSRPQEPN